MDHLEVFYHWVWSLIPWLVLQIYLASVAGRIHRKDLPMSLRMARGLQADQGLPYRPAVQAAIGMHQIAKLQ